MRATGTSCAAVLFCLVLFGWLPSAFVWAAQAPGDDVFRGVSYVGITVSDLEVSSKLYAESADLEVVATETLSGSVLDALSGKTGVSVPSTLLRSTNAQVRLMQVPGLTEVGPVPPNGPGMAHVCYQSDATRETFERFVKRGVKTLGHPELVELTPRNPVVYAYSLDPDGVMFEVEHIDVEKATHLPKGFYRIRHISLATPDIERSLAFYSALLKAEPRRLGGTEGLSGEPFDQVSGLPGTRLLMAWFQVRNLELEIVQYLSHPTEVPEEPRPLAAPGYNMIVFDVVSLDAAKKRLAAAGGEVVLEPQAMDGGEVFFGRDPDGNLLGFLVAPEDSPVSSMQFKTQGG